MPNLRQSLTDADLISHSLATAHVPPKASMMSESVMADDRNTYSTMSRHSYHGANYRAGMEPWAQRIKNRMEETGTSQADLARACSMASPSISDWWNGKTKMISGDKLVLAARALGVSCAWIIEGGSVTAVTPSQPARLDEKNLLRAAEIVEASIQIAQASYRKGLKRPKVEFSAKATVLAYDALCRADQIESINAYVASLLRMEPLVGEE